MGQIWKTDVAAAAAPTVVENSDTEQAGTDVWQGANVALRISTTEKTVLTTPITITKTSNIRIGYFLLILSNDGCTDTIRLKRNGTTINSTTNYSSTKQINITYTDSNLPAETYTYTITVQRTAGTYLFDYVIMPCIYLVAIST